MAFLLLVDNGGLMIWDVSNASGCHEGDVATQFSQCALLREVRGDE